MPQQTINAPFPGVFYRCPAPDKPPFVEPGQRVEPETTIGLLEVMKQFVALKAEMSGTLTAFEVEDESVLEAGQAIASVEGA